MSQPQSPIAAMSQSSTQSSAQIVSLQADLSNLRLVPAISISLIGPRKSPYRSARCALWLFVAGTVCADFLQLLLRFDFMTRVSCFFVGLYSVTGHSGLEQGASNNCFTTSWVLILSRVNHDELSWSIAAGRQHSGRILTHSYLINKIWE